MHDCKLLSCHSVPRENSAGGKHHILF
jgi:hypothetical protein